MLKKILFCTGVFLCVYPFLSHVFEDKKQLDAITAYQKQIEELAQNDVEECIDEAEKYNRMLYQNGGTIRNKHQKNYQELLNPVGNGMMGSIEIPKIKVHLPIYHGTEEEVLEIGVGHLQGSSLPVGGEHTHCLLAGHRGMPDSELFTRLGELEIGDKFYIHVCNQTFVYKVCEIQVIKPEDTETLGIQSGRDLVSLITCTPYGINTHRLIVTGERMEGK